MSGRTHSWEVVCSILTGFCLYRCRLGCHDKGVVARSRFAVKQPRRSSIVPIGAALACVWCAVRCTTNEGSQRVRGQSGSEVVSNGGSGGGGTAPGGNGALPGGDTVPCPCSAQVANDYTTTAMLRVTLLERAVQR